jgi:hypothetical protein
MFCHVILCVLLYLYVGVAQHFNHLGCWHAAPPRTWNPIATCAALALRICVRVCTLVLTASGRREEGAAAGARNSAANAARCVSVSVTTSCAADVPSGEAVGASPSNGVVGAVVGSGQAAEVGDDDWVMVGVGDCVGGGAAEVEAAVAEGLSGSTTTGGGARKRGACVLLPRAEDGTTRDACAPMDSSQRASNDAFWRHGGDVIPPARNDSSMRTAMKSMSAASCRGGPTNTLGNASSSRVYAACDRTTCTNHTHKQTSVNILQRHDDFCPFHWPDKEPMRGWCG